MEIASESRNFRVIFILCLRLVSFEAAKTKTEIVSESDVAVFVIGVAKSRPSRGKIESRNKLLKIMCSSTGKSELFQRHLFIVDVFFRTQRFNILQTLLLSNFRHWTVIRDRENAKKHPRLKNMEIWIMSECADNDFSTDLQAKQLLEMKNGCGFFKKWCINWPTYFMARREGGTEHDAMRKNKTIKIAQETFHKFIESENVCNKFFFCDFLCQKHADGEELKRRELIFEAEKWKNLNVCGWCKWLMNFICFFLDNIRL